MAARYDSIGRTYTATRQTDPRIAARIWAALGDGRTVVNVGAGTGSYEPPDHEVTAVEPSAVMIAQRPPHAARAVQATAEHLPFEDDSLPRWRCSRCTTGATGGRDARRSSRRTRSPPRWRSCRCPGTADGFFSAFWRRPEAYLDPAVRAGISTMAKREDELADGLARLRADLESGEWARRHAGLLEREEMDLGYRLLIGRP